MADGAELESPFICLHRCHRQISKNSVRHRSVLPSICIGRRTSVSLQASQRWLALPLTEIRKKWCLDANAVAQEKGVEAVLAIVQYSGESSAK